jgi:hypothetical protein
MANAMAAVLDLKRDFMTILRGWVVGSAQAAKAIRIRRRSW